MTTPISDSNALALRESRTRRDDEARDTRTTVIIVGVLAASLGVAATVQSVLIFGLQSADLHAEASPLAELARRFSINLVSVTIVTLCAATLRLPQRRRAVQIALSAAVGTGVALVRAGLQLVGGVYLGTQLDAAAPDALVVAVMVTLVFMTALTITRAQQRARREARERVFQATLASDALASLQQEELRVRRLVADGIHGSLQNRFVILAAELGSIARESSAPHRERIDAVRRQLDELRETELRSLSSALYPERLDDGLVPAARALLARLPAGIATRLRVRDTAASNDRDMRLIDVSKRLLLVRVIEEALTNALKHGTATSVALFVFREERSVTIEFHDDGVGIDGPIELHGLALLRDRLHHHRGELTLDSSAEGGVVVRAGIPLNPDEEVPAPAESAPLQHRTEPCEPATA
ncbi:sensor histidine kinase [Agromyces atrinae]|uniref:histidine kinase n=1 Tax=Agromyces atrinae TaxID=592376 RepID=A0A4Q2M2A0_9MICO|nr:ATP-binding protein [Agromyces atrinae]NYD68503.1 signal transduction histidine kinase [Agromyces atrinae]RXZ85889.1 hypothetical protein ESP50_11765 [Agromyces atrinae]